MKKINVWLQRIGHAPKNRMITVGHFGLLDVDSMVIKSTTRKVSWYPISQIRDLAFNHNIILNKAFQNLKARMRVSPIGYRLLPRKFCLSQLQTLPEVVYGISLDKRNFRKKITKLKYLIPMDENNPICPINRRK